MGHIQQHSVQCVLVINIFNEKIFVFLWFWYHILVIASAFSFIYWTVVTLFPCFPRWYITRHLELADMPFDPKESADDVNRFVSGYLRIDGVFVIRMISMHTGVIFTSDVVASLWKSFFGVENQVKKQQSKVSAMWPALHSISELGKGGSKLDEPDAIIRHRTTAPGKLIDATVESGYKSDNERSQLVKHPEDQEIMMPTSKADWIIDSESSLEYYSANSSLPESMKDAGPDSPYGKYGPNSPFAKMPATA